MCQLVGASTASIRAVTASAEAICNFRWSCSASAEVVIASAGAVIACAEVVAAFVGAVFGVFG